MTAEYSDYELLDGSATGNRRSYAIRTLSQYGDLEIDPFCRENFIMRAVRARVGDRDFEFNAGRGGESVYVVVDTGIPETYEVKEERWVFGEKVIYDPDEDSQLDTRLEGILLQNPGLSQEQAWAVVNGVIDPLPPGLTYVGPPPLDDDQAGGPGRLDQVGYYFEKLNSNGQLSSRRIVYTWTGQVAAVDLFNPATVGTCGPLHPDEELKGVPMLSPGQVERNIKALSPEQLAKAHITGSSESSLRRLRPVISAGQLAIKTKELTEAAVQEFRGPWNMLSKRQLNKRLAHYCRLKHGTPNALVPYPMTGCSPKGQRPALDDEVGWRDNEYRQAILLRCRRDLPGNLVWDGAADRYKVPVGSLDLDGLRVLAHNDIEKATQTACDVYRSFMASLVFAAICGRRDRRAEVWEILAHYGEDGLQTGSRQLLEEYLAAERLQRPQDLCRFGYVRLSSEMRQALARNREGSGLFPGAMPFWDGRGIQTTFASAVETGIEDHSAVDAYANWLKVANRFVEENFDRSYPSEQFEFKKRLSEAYGAHDDGDSLSKARALQRLVSRTIHVIQPPKTEWVFVEERGVGAWKLNVDWSTFRYFAEPVEAMRDWARKVHEWQMSEAANNAYAAMSFDSRTADGLRANDLGGIWGPVRYQHDWAFALLNGLAKSRAPMPQKPIRIESESAEDWLRRVRDYSTAIEKRVAILGWPWWEKDPDDQMPHDGSLRVLTLQRWVEFASSITQLRGFSVELSVGLVPRYEDFLREQMAALPNYQSESEWLEADEGALRDPQAIWGYLGGVLRTNALAIINQRVHRASSSSEAYPELRLYRNHTRDGSATLLRDEVTALWKNADVEVLERRLWQVFYDGIREGVIHLRPLYMKVLNGLPVTVIEQLDPTIRGLNRRSDRRVRLWAANLSTSFDHEGRRAFTLPMWQRLVEEGYGTHTYPNVTSDEEQYRQDSLGLLAWKSSQYDKAINLVRSLVLARQFLADVMDSKRQIISAVHGGLSLQLAWEVIEVIGKTQRGLIFDVRDTFPRLEEIEQDPAIKEMNDKFEAMLISTNGRSELMAVVTGELHKQLRAAHDPDELRKVQ